MDYRYLSFISPDYKPHASRPIGLTFKKPIINKRLANWVKILMSIHQHSYESWKVHVARVLGRWNSDPGFVPNGYYSKYRMSFVEAGLISYSDRYGWELTDRGINFLFSLQVAILDEREV